LRETLQSIINQTYKDWELVIINDGSADATESIVFEYIQQGYPIIYHYQENKGLGTSRNEAITRSNGKYIAFIDHDDLWMPEKLEKQVPPFNENPRVGMIISDVIFFNEKGDVKRYYGKWKPPSGNIFKYLLKRYFISLTTVVIRRSALDTVNGWFDERFNIAEDKDLFVRIAHDWEVLCIYEPLAKWRMSLNSLTFTRRVLFPKENELLLGKLLKIYSDFESQYREEIFYLKANVAFYYALMDWENRDNKKARDRLIPYLAIRKYAIIYVLTYLPYGIYRMLYRLKGWSPL
jgi:glycosyltransferase involved in cell wall biosynthesis